MKINLKLFFNMKNIFFYLLLLFTGVYILAQDTNDEQLQAQANNPLAKMTAISFHNYYMPKFTNAPSDAYINSTWIRFAKPMINGKLLVRISAPINTQGIPDVDNVVQTTNGLGDINTILAYSFVSNPTTTLGGGLVITAPTATEDILGTGKWQGGLSLVGFFSKSPVFQYGALATWQASFAGDKDRSKTNNATFQYFAFWQLGKGYYLRSAPVWIFDIENEQHQIPFAAGAGKVIKMGKTVFNIFMEPQYTMLHKGVQPQFQLFTGINLQFIN